MVRNKRMMAAVCGILLCGLLGACGRREDENLVLIGQDGSVVSSGEEAQGPSPVGSLGNASQGGCEPGAAPGRNQEVPKTGMDPDGNQVVPGNGAGTGKGSGTPEAGSGGEGFQVPEIYVHVCGAVANPGVYARARGSRGEDALLAAGGFAQDADQDYVNLAKPVSDGEKLYFPDQSETAGKLPMEQDTGGNQEDTRQGLVDINRADREGLCSLPGIGPARAEDIITYREAHGAFRKCEDIMKVSGIKDSVYQKIKDKITVQ